GLLPYSHLIKDIGHKTWDGCEPSSGCWELNSGPLEEQSVFLTSEPPLQPALLHFEHQHLLCSQASSPVSLEVEFYKLLICLDKQYKNSFSKSLKLTRFTKFLLLQA
uniref:Uncharacterized protein n=1 Tax=Mus spicilegus TaxID=10103 RepID=A0A8C6IH03_MUSSI